MEEKKRITVTLVHPDSRKTVTVPLKRFTPANFEAFTDVETDGADRFAEIMEDARQLDENSDMEFAERRAAIREKRREMVRARIVSTWQQIVIAMDLDRIKDDVLRRAIELDPEEDDSMIALQNFDEIDAALRSFRGLLGLAK